jgi:UDPglucose 6-dehydrogenase
MREAPSRVLIEGLVGRGARVQAFDPVAMHEAQRSFGPLEGLRYVDRAMAALEGADALVIATEWKEFRSPDFAAVKTALREGVVFDGRNMYAPDFVESAGLEYHAIGRLTAAVRRQLSADAPR